MGPKSNCRGAMSVVLILANVLLCTAGHGPCRQLTQYATLNNLCFFRGKPRDANMSKAYHYRSKRAVHNRQLGFLADEGGIFEKLL